MYCVYIFQNKLDNKLYVGKTNNLEHRKRCHEYDSKNPSNYFHKAIAKYGLENFNSFVIEEWELEKDCLEAEQFWIEFFQSNHRSFGYNLTDGGEGISGYRHTTETKEKFKITNKDKTLGLVHSEKSKNLMSKKQLANHEKNSQMNSGENNPNSKLVESDVLEILRLLKAKTMTSKEIAKRFNVKPLTIYRINSGRSWTNLREEDD